VAQYLLSVHSVDGQAREPMTDEETAQSHHQLGILEQEMKSAGTSNTAAFSAEAVAVVAVAVELGPRPVHHLTGVRPDSWR